MNIKKHLDKGQPQGLKLCTAIEAAGDLDGGLAVILSARCTATSTWHQLIHTGKWLTQILAPGLSDISGYITKQVVEDLKKLTSPLMEHELGIESAKQTTGIFLSLVRKLLTKTDKHLVNG
ncbi:hypothetical protein PtB15_14B247 [Puccinia triticina]|nr:hypothetical protein PtB15_14B247 [Puccinia triticina]